MLNPRHLVHFQTALRHGNLHRAARDLGISQPALSKSIQALEVQLDGKLFVRSSRGVEPTPLGTALSAHAGVIVSELLAAEAAAAHFRGGSRRSLRMGSGPTFCDWLMPAAIGEFRRRFPTTRLLVSINLRDVLQRRLMAGEIDFYVGRLDETNRVGTSHEVLYKDRLAVCCRSGHPLNHGRPVEVADLAEYEWAFIESQGAALARPQLLRVFMEHGLGPPRTALETESTTLVYALARESDVLCLRPVFAGRRSVSIGGLVELPVPASFPHITRAIIHRDPAGFTGTDLAMLGILHEVATDAGGRNGSDPFADELDAILPDPALSGLIDR